VTISNQHYNSWFNLFKKGLTTVLEKRLANDVEFRKSLPDNYLDSLRVKYQTGSASLKNDKEVFDSFKQKYIKRLDELVKDLKSEK
jgi:hypothetical protein